MRADVVKTAAPVVGALVAFVGVAVAWDSPLQPVDSLELVYAAIVLAISGSLGVIVGRVLWKRLRKPGIAMITGLVITVVSAPWVLLGAWAVNGAAVDAPAEEAECVLVEAQEPHRARDVGLATLRTLDRSVWGDPRRLRVPPRFERPGG